MDTISTYLTAMRVTHFEAGTATCRLPWAVSCPRGTWDIVFYATRGAPSRLSIPALGIEELIQPLTICVILGGHAHLAQDEQRSGVPIQAKMRLPTTVERYRTIIFGGNEGPETTTFYMGFDLGGWGNNPLLRALPEVLIHTFEAEPTWLEMGSRWLRDELIADRPGRHSAAARLGELLMIESVRAFVAAHPDAIPKWLRRPVDQKLARVLSILNDDIARVWKLEDLAAAVGTSRARLCASAQAQLGEGVFRYSQRLRMFEACRLLTDSNIEIVKIASLVGYASPAAFITAFHRHFGTTPKHYRAGRSRVSRQVDHGQSRGVVQATGRESPA